MKRLLQFKHEHLTYLNVSPAQLLFALLGLLLLELILGFTAPGGKVIAKTAPSLPPEEIAQSVAHGRYLAIIGVCSACHTPPNVATTKPTDVDELTHERLFRTDPDWFQYLDPGGKNYFSGGVPFILRFPGNKSGVVYSTNITPDSKDGLGNWTVEEIAETIRSGKRPVNRKPGISEFLYLFPPHIFYRNMSKYDALSLAYYLKSIPKKSNQVPIPNRHLPPEYEPTKAAAPLYNGPTPEGRTIERAQYLTRAVVGCRECHSHHSNPDIEPELQQFAVDSEERKTDPLDWLGPLLPFAGGGPTDPYEGVFRLGPDLPLRTDEKGVSLFPYPGYAVLYGGNLTRFGNGGDLSDVSIDKVVRAIRQGISTQQDIHGRDRPLSQVMMWPFYHSMRDDDVYAIAEYLKALTYIPNEFPQQHHLTLYGEDWQGMFHQVFQVFQKKFGEIELPSNSDRRIYGKE